MALPGLLIEYLVVGSMALLWMLPLVGLNLSEKIPFGSAAALAPAIYILGMFVDFIAYALLSLIPSRKHSLKTLARKLAHQKADIRRIEGNVINPEPGKNTRRRIWLQQNAPDIIKEVNERSSRDRIARGAFINLLIMWLVSLTESVPLLGGLNNLQWFVLVFLSLMIWLFFEGNSYSFEVRASEIVPKMSPRRIARGTEPLPPIRRRSAG